MRVGRDMLLGARFGSEILANDWGQERRERHAFGCKVRLKKSWPIIGDNRDGERHVFGRALVRWKSHDAYSLRKDMKDRRGTFSGVVLDGF
jgi:hypothetical protein